MKDYALESTENGLEFGFGMADSLRNNLMLSLLVRRGSLFSATWFGSRLHVIEHVTPQDMELARDYCMEALRWLIQTGRIVSADIQVEQDLSDRNRMNILVTATKPTGDIEPITLHYSVV